MRYYIDLSILAVWIGLFIHLLGNSDSIFLYPVSIIAVISCIIHGIDTMFGHDCANYCERKAREESNEEEKNERD
jgi:hypothetical protein